MRNLEDNTLLLLVIAVSLASAWILLPFYEAVLWATVLAVVFAPLYRRLSSSMGQQHSLAALATVLKDFLLDACDPLGARLSRGL